MNMHLVIICQKSALEYLHVTAKLLELDIEFYFLYANRNKEFTFTLQRPTILILKEQHLFTKKFLVTLPY